LFFLQSPCGNSAQAGNTVYIYFPLKASITDLQVECSEAQLEMITASFQKGWKDIAKLLGLDKNVLSKIEESSRNPFAEIISNWKKKREDNPFTYDTLITELSNSSEFIGRKEYVEQTILSHISCKLCSSCADISEIVIAKVMHEN